MPYGRIYEGDIELTFLEDSLYNVRKTFTEWQSKIISNSNATCSYYDEYVCDVMTITSFTQKDEPSYSVNVYDVFIKNVNSIPLNTAGGEFVKTVVSLSFRKWSDVSEESENTQSENQTKKTKTSPLSALGPKPGSGF
jgi:uncharacterized membrane protein